VAGFEGKSMPITHETSHECEEIGIVCGMNMGKGSFTVVEPK
jgi:hypothetical protein